MYKSKYIEIQMVFSRERGRIERELRDSKMAIYQRNYYLNNLEKLKERNRKGAKKFYDKNRGDKVKLPNFNCIICKNLIEENPNGRKFKCIECKFKERAKVITDLESRKYISRLFTGELLGHLRKGLCLRCKEQKKLEFHHKIYPITAKGIREAFRNQDIILVCRKCHFVELHKCRYTKS